MEVKFDEINGKFKIKTKGNNNMPIEHEIQTDEDIEELFFLPISIERLLRILSHIIKYNISLKTAIMERICNNRQKFKSLLILFSESDSDILQNPSLIQNFMVSPFFPNIKQQFILAQISKIQERIENDSSQNQITIQRIISDLHQIPGQLSELSELQTRQLNQAILDIQRQIHNNEEHFNGEISNLKGEISNINGDMSNIHGDLSNINGDISNITGGMTTLQGETSTFRGEIANIIRGMAIFEKTLIRHFDEYKVRFQNDTSFISNGFVWKRDEEGVLWKKIFYQHFDGNTKDLISKDDILNLNVNHSHYYSIFQELKDSKYITEGRYDYEFLLDYPEIPEFGFNKWSQTSNPTISRTVENYHPIHISFPVYSFCGLKLSEFSASTMHCCGQPNRQWYTIGYAEIVAPPYRDFIPGPGLDRSKDNFTGSKAKYQNKFSYGNLGIKAHDVNLWVRATAEDQASIP